MAEDPGIDLTAITPEQFAQLVSGASDDEVVTALRAVGVETSLDRIFEGMQERFAPDKARDVEADVTFVVKDGDKEFPYTVSIHGGTCAAGRGRAESPRSTLTTDLVSFVRLITGGVFGPQLFMSGKLNVAGDLMFSTRVETFFDRPNV